MSGLTALFKKPKTPKLENPAVPSRSDAEVAAAADEQRRRLSASTSAQSWLTGGTGVSQNPNNYAAAKLLSGV